MFFALYSKDHQQIFAIYSNTSFSEATRFHYLWYTQPVNSDTGKLYGDAVVFPSQLLVNETWLQQALNTTKGFASLGKSLNDVNNLLVLNTAGVDKNGVISLRFDLKSLMNVFSGVKPLGGGLYLAAKYGKVFVLALPYEGLPNKMHIIFVSAFLSITFVVVAISIFSFVVLIVRASRKKMCLKAELIKQKEATEEAERKRKNHNLAFVSASHDIRGFLTRITGLIEISINDVHQGTELANNLRFMQDRSQDLNSIHNSILDTSKIEAGKMQLEEKQFELAHVLEGMVDLFYHVGLKKDVDVILDLQDGSLIKFSQVKETTPQLEGTGLGLGIVRSLVRMMGGEISIVDKEVGEKGACFRFNVVFKVCQSDLSSIHEDNKSVSPGYLSAGEFRREQQNICSSKSDLNLSFGYLTWPTSRDSNTRSREVPLSSLDGTDVSPIPTTNKVSVSNFRLLVIDTTSWADFRELCKTVAEFRRDSKNGCSRVVWLGSRCIQLQGLDEKEAPTLRYYHTHATPWIAFILIDRSSP
ncbi:hypothetical protein L6452_28102 [Arctium lappa]|uniref:Uncharacterized protein n=1 Tax=Arctium lappa TaxID=4217 RepID=A0ACB8ZXC2_ARCLA|nr:hypothetical protein L6452_28102 [Arctium lappa]